MDIVQLVRDLGIPVALLLAVIYGGWQGCQWLASEVLKPVVTKTLEFLEKLEAAVDRIASKLDKVVDQQGELVAKVDRISLHGCANYHVRGGNDAKPGI